MDTQLPAYDAQPISAPDLREKPRSPVNSHELTMPRNVQIDGNRISDWDSFHNHFAETLGFPVFYGRNMNAWNDCMTYLDDPAAGMTSVHVAPGDVLVLCISGATDLKKRCPEIYEALVECSAFVNYRRIEKGEQAVIAISFSA